MNDHDNLEPHVVFDVGCGFWSVLAIGFIAGAVLTIIVYALSG